MLKVCVPHAMVPRIFGLIILSKGRLSYEYVIPNDRIKRRVCAALVT